MNTLMNIMLCATLIAGIGGQIVTSADAQTRGEASSPNDPSPDRDPGRSPGEDSNDGGLVLGKLAKPTETRNGSFHCPPSSTNTSGSGICGLPLQSQENICTGRGGGSSTGPDGGHTCVVN